MTPYLTWQEYEDSGGRATESSFPLLERRARAKLDYWTQDRICEITPDIKLCMVLIINALYSVGDGDQAFTSFSNDGVSVSLGTKRTEDEAINSVYSQVVEILPVELVSVVIR